MNFEELLDTIATLTEQIRGEHRELVAHERWLTPDGFASSSWSPGGVSGGNPVDEDGEPEDRPDSVLGAVLAREADRNPARQARRIVEAKGVEVRRLLDEMVSAARRVMYPPDRMDDTPSPVLSDRALWCSHHLVQEPPMFEPILAVGLCRYCYEWSRNAEAQNALPGSAYQMPPLPPRLVLDVRARGKNVTNKVIEDALRPETKRSRKNKKRKVA